MAMTVQQANCRRSPPSRSGFACTMKAIASLSLLVFARNAFAHGDHGPEKGETMQQYAQRHMSSEHHIDTFDTRSFHQLHDLDRDGFWNREEIEAIYGVHHVYSTKKSKDDVEHQKKADHIVNTVLHELDLNHDGKVSPEELERVGLNGLPNFEHMGAEGHHYDVESEFFLHHEEKYHSTPETQSDDAYNHPEDLEHFAQHEAIELEEAKREAKFQGITVEEVLKSQEEQAKAAISPQDRQQQPLNGTPEHAPDVPVPMHPHDDQAEPHSSLREPSTTKITRIPPPEKQDPSIRYKAAAEEAQEMSDYGSGKDGYRRPTNPTEILRRNMPYKYKFRRAWGDF